jgi:sulfate/thiosulfate transport system ATP-binding protein
VRRATLAVSASILRHVSAEAVYLGIMPQQTPMAQRPHGMRALLDARSEAQAVHGLEMRTELRFGDVAHELARQLGELPGQMLILGIRGYANLADRFGSLFAEGHWPVLIVNREHEGPAG